MLIVILIVLAMVAGVFPAMIAGHKGHGSGWWWLFGAALFPLALPLALRLKATPATLLLWARDREHDLAFRECPACCEDIRREATSCRFCGRVMTPSGS